MDLITTELTSKELLSSYLGIFKFKPDERFEFLPGQYVTLGVRRKGLEGPGVRIKDSIGTVFRPFSIVSAPDEDEIELIIIWVQSDGRRLDEWGVFTTELFNPQPGQEYIMRRKPKGKFLLPQDSRDVIMVATGTGIAPYVSILRDMKSGTVDRRCFLIHGVSKLPDLAYMDELSNYHSLNVKYQRTISRDQCDECESRYVEEYFVNRNGKTGRLSVDEVGDAIKNGQINDTKIERLLGAKMTPDNAVIMLCGNPGMIENITIIAKEKNFQLHKDIIVESYW